MAPNSTFVQKAKFWLKATPKSKTKSKISKCFLSMSKSKIIWRLLGFAFSVLPNYSIRLPPFNENKILLLMNKGKILQVRKVSNRAEYWKIVQVFFFYKRLSTRFWWITGKYCESEKFQIEQNTGKFSKCFFFYERLSTAPKASFFQK